MAFLKNFQQFVNESTAQMSNEQHEDTWRENNSGKVSDCCSAPVVYPGICAACGENAKEIEETEMSNSTENDQMIY